MKPSTISLSQEDYAAILVDFDGTLYRQTPMRLLMAAELLLFGFGSIRALRAFRREQEGLRLRTGKVIGNPASGWSPFQRQVASAAAKTGMPPERMRKIVDEWMFRRPEKWLGRFVRWPLVLELEARTRAGVKLAVVSDYPVRRKLEALGLPFQIDAIVASGEAGGPTSLKPNPEGYLLAASRLDANPSLCLVIGDREDTDGEAARRAGMSFQLVS